MKTIMLSSWISDCFRLSVGILLFVGLVEPGLIRTLQKRTADTCVHDLIADHKTASFVSPNHPANYPDSTDCTWWIRSPLESKILINFIIFDVEDERKCQYDYLLVYDGPDSTFPQLGRFCGSTMPQELNSTSYHMFIEFHSDGSDSRIGFEIGYKAVGGHIGDHSAGGSMSEVTPTDISYGSSLDSSVTLAPSSNSDSSVDSGWNTQTDGSWPAPWEQMLSSEAESNNLNTDTDMQNGGEIEVDGCNQIWRNYHHGNITSPGYPDRYPSNADCTIIIYAPSDNQRIDLAFHSFDVEPLCDFDYVLIKNTVLEETGSLGLFCGQELPGSVQSSTGVLVVKFISDVADEMGGFTASFSVHAAAEVENVGQSSSSVSEGASSSITLSTSLEFVQRPMDMVELRPGERVEQECTVDSEGAVITWIKDGQEIPKGEETDGIRVSSDGTLLVIDHVDLRHEGRLQCHAEVAGMEPISDMFVLQIADDGSPDYYESREPLLDLGPVNFMVVPSNSTISDGVDHILNCAVTSGSYRLVWEKDGEELVFSSRVNRIFKANLLIGDSRVHDTGLYTCVVYGRRDVRLAEASAFVTVVSHLDIADVCGRVSAPEAEVPIRKQDKYRISNGYKAKKGSSPWIVRLWHNRKLNHFCGGSLINNRWVLTAAHCIEDRTHIYYKYNIEVWLGDHDSANMEDSEMKFKVSRIILHPDYSEATFDSDIALLELEGRVPIFTSYVSPICLPEPDVAGGLLEAVSMARVAGWGKIMQNGEFPQFLREVELPIVPQDICINSSRHAVTENMFCAGYAQEARGDACKGDSGGPLVQELEGRWYVAGIVSWGEGCDTAGHYGFYTKVANFVQWIQRTLIQ